MKKLQKIGSLLLALALVLAVSTAFADQTLTGGEVGGYTTADTQNVDDKVVSIQKEITVYNPDEALIFGPAITYTYTVTPVTTGVSITDETTDHTSGVAASTTTLAGITTGVKVNGGTAGGEASASGTLAWTNADILDAAAAGTANCKEFTLDFTDVVFTQPGVYRYLITESADAYTTSGVTETTGTHTRYLDVYVMRSADYDETALTSDDWKIYGYVCTIENEAITPDGDTTTTGAVKTNGFVAATNDSTAVKADEFHTFNLTIGKTLAGDTTMNGHKFPFDAAWAEEDETAVAFTGGTAALSNNDKTATMIENATAAYAQEAAPDADTNTAIQFTNTLSIISPTGYVVRYAPYGLMLIGGIALLIVAKKHRKHTEEDE